MSSRGHVLLRPHARVQENLHSSPDHQLHYQSTTVANSVFIVRWFCVGHVAEFRTRGCGGDSRVKRSTKLMVSGTVNLDLFCSSEDTPAPDQRHTGWHGACRYATRPISQT